MPRRSARRRLPRAAALFATDIILSAFGRNFNLLPRLSPLLARSLILPPFTLSLSPKSPLKPSLQRIFFEYNYLYFIYFMHHFFLFPDAQKNGGKTVWKCGGIGKKSSFSSTFFNFVFPDEKRLFKNETMHGSDLSALFPQKSPPRRRGGPSSPSFLLR